MPESKNWKKNWQKNVSGGRLPRTIPTVRCGSMKLLQKNMCFPESLEESGIPPTWSSKTIRNRCITGDLYIRMTGRLLMNSVLPPDSAYSLFPGTPSFSGHLLFQTFLQFLLYLSFLTIPFLPVSLPFHPVRMPPPPAFHLFEAVPPLSAYYVHPPVLSPSVFPLL